MCVNFGFSPRERKFVLAHPIRSDFDLPKRSPVLDTCLWYPDRFAFQSPNGKALGIYLEKEWTSSRTDFVPVIDDETWVQLLRFFAVAEGETTLGKDSAAVSFTLFVIFISKERIS